MMEVHLLSDGKSFIQFEITNQCNLNFSEANGRRSYRSGFNFHEILMSWKLKDTMQAELKYNLIWCCKSSKYTIPSLLFEVTPEQKWPNLKELLCSQSLKISDLKLRLEAYRWEKDKWWRFIFIKTKKNWPSETLRAADENLGK